MSKKLLSAALAAAILAGMCGCRPISGITTTHAGPSVGTTTTATGGTGTSTTSGTSTGTSTVTTATTTSTVTTTTTAATTTTTTTTAPTSSSHTAGTRRARGAPMNEGAVDYAAIRKLDAAQVPWGPGPNFDENDRPVACVQLQQKYGKFNAWFVRDDEKTVYLTFDEGYENGYTPSILDTLAQKGVKAVFFVTQDYAKKEPELVRRMIAEGHVIGSHSVTHPNMTKVTLERDYNEIAGIHEYMIDNFEYEMHLFRPPEGAFSEQTLTLLNTLGYDTILWSFAYADWDPNNQPEPQKALQRATSHVHGGEIFLLHAVSKTNAEILGQFIDEVREQGFTFALLP